MALFTNLVSKIRQVDLKLGGGSDTLSRQLTAGAKTAVIATGITTLAKVPAVINVAKTAIIGSSKAVSKSISTQVATKPLTSAAVATFGTGLIITSKKPVKAISKAPEAIFEAGVAVGEVIEGKSIDPLIAYGKEHPIAAGLAGAGAAYLVGKGAAGALVTSKLLDTGKQAPITPALPAESSTIPAMLAGASTSGATVPYTPETMTVTAKSTSVARRYYKRKEHKPNINNIRINILNQSRLIRAY